MKETTNIKIDADLKRLFESTKEIHHKFLGDAAEIGIRIILTELKNQTILEQEKKRTDLEIMALTQKTTNIQKLIDEIASLKIPVVGNNGNGHDETEEMRNERFKDKYGSPEKIESLKRMMEKCVMNWDRIIELYKFKNKLEAREWFEKKLKEV